MSLNVDNRLPQLFRVTLFSMISVPLLFIVGLIVLPLVEMVFRWRRSVRLRLPKGPTPWPFLGNIRLLRQFETLPEQTCLYLAHKFGGVCMVWFGNGPVVIVNSAKAAYNLFHVVSTQMHSCNSIVEKRFRRMQRTLLRGQNTTTFVSQSVKAGWF